MPYIGRHSTPFSIGSTSNTYVQAQGYLTAEVGDVSNTYLQNAGFASNTYLNTALSTKVDETHTGDVTITGNTSVTDTIQDSQGNVRALERNVISSTPYDFPAASSGKYFVCNVNSLTINIDGADISLGDIFTIWSFPNNGDVTISWTNMTNGVYIAGDTNNKGTSGSITLAAGGLCTVLCDTDSRMVFSGNVS